MRVHKKQADRQTDRQTDGRRNRAKCITFLVRNVMW